MVLAAGSSTRFSAGSKQLALLDGRPLVAIAVQAALDAACFDTVVVVTGAVGLDAVLPEGVEVCHNPAWSSGQASSLQTGIEAARRRGAAAVVVGLADQPRVSAEDWRSVAMVDTERPAVVATYGGVPGNPVRLAAAIWSELPREGDEGARALLRGRPDLVTAVACRGDATDVDTVEDLDRWN